MSKKKILCLVAVAMLTLALAIPCFAEGETSASSGISSDITSAFSTGFSQIASDAVTILALIIPIALSIVGIIWVSKKAITWWRGMSH